MVGSNVFAFYAVLATWPLAAGSVMWLLAGLRPSCSRKPGLSWDDHTACAVLLHKIDLTRRRRVTPINPVHLALSYHKRFALHTPLYFDAVIGPSVDCLDRHRLQSLTLIWHQVDTIIVDVKLKTFSIVR